MKVSQSISSSDEDVYFGFQKQLSLTRGIIPRGLQLRREQGWTASHLSCHLIIRNLWDSEKPNLTCWVSVLIIEEFQNIGGFC